MLLAFASDYYYSNSCRRCAPRFSTPGEPGCGQLVVVVANSMCGLSDGIFDVRGIDDDSRENRKEKVFIQPILYNRHNCSVLC